MCAMALGVTSVIGPKCSVITLFSVAGKRFGKICDVVTGATATGECNEIQVPCLRLVVFLRRTPGQSVRQSKSVFRWRIPINLRNYQKFVIILRCSYSLR